MRGPHQLLALRKAETYLEPVQHLPHSQVSLQDPPVPNRPLERLVAECLGRQWLSHCKQGQRQVDKGVSVSFELLALDYFVQLQTHQTCRPSYLEGNNGKGKAMPLSSALQG